MVIILFPEALDFLLIFCHFTDVNCCPPLALSRLSRRKGEDATTTLMPLSGSFFLVYKHCFSAFSHRLIVVPATCTLWTFHKRKKMLKH